ncbi:mitochondrial inheritance component MDM10 [Plectosphaerella plurivora]|uniref:Mitochondrial distribution and morphology protein 10 n=1 Tax=Plectosphaerella plurivora TaxID=936078 RepID=A0A9P9AC54_9PEZI|nr:mitochondrial inheritance component MDM10 [Plectosphaerella plurivora]
MRQFMDYIRSAFYDATNWNRESSYKSLNTTADALIDFDTPCGVRLTLSSLASPNFATSYELGSVGVVDGSISYLYSSVPLRAYVTPQSERLPLAKLLRSYKPLPELPQLQDVSAYDLLSSQAASLMYGRLYLPESHLEALLVKRISPALQVQVSVDSGSAFRGGGTVLGVAQYDVGRYALEGLASSDGGLLGFLGLYNFGGEGSDILPLGSPSPKDDGGDRIYGRFSAGGEIYYGTLNNTGGMSVGARFATLPSHTGTPLTATMTLNPLMGSIRATYAVMAGRNCSLATRFDFDFYSYESAWAVGMELWRKRRVRDVLDPAMSAEGLVKERSFQAKLDWRLDEPDNPVLTPVVAPVKEQKPKERSFQAKLEWRLDDPDAVEEEATPPPPDDEYSGVIKARLDQNMRIGVQWEGRAKSLLFSLGSGIDLRNVESPFRTVGVEIQFSS